MPKRDLTHFVVEGYGQFPLDMLRYDQCWPATQHDAVLMESMRERRRLCLCTWECTAPTVARWESFMWQVVHVGYPDAAYSSGIVEKTKRDTAPTPAR